MTRSSLLLIPLIALAACSTPRERCIAGANRPVATLDRLITTTRGNIERGFALSTCEGTNADGSTFRFPCEETETFTRNEPVAINVAEERTKLNQLLERRADAVRNAQATAQQCVAVHPE